MGTIVSILVGIGGFFGKLINGAIDLLGSIPQAVLEKAVLAVMIGGLGWFACRTYYDVPVLQADHTYAESARKAQAAADEAYQASLRDHIAFLQQQVKDQEANFNLAMGFLTAQTAGAQSDKDRALAQLDKEKTLVQTTANFCGSALTRVLLDHAAGADLGAGEKATAQSTAAGGASGAEAAAAKAPILSCEQLGRGYVALAQWARGTWADFTAFQVWFKKTYPPEKPAN